YRNNFPTPHQSTPVKPAARGLRANKYPTFEPTDPVARNTSSGGLPLHTYGAGGSRFHGPQPILLTLRRAERFHHTPQVSATQVARDIPCAAKKPHRQTRFRRDWSRIL